MARSTWRLTPGAMALNATVPAPGGYPFGGMVRTLQLVTGIVVFVGMFVASVALASLPTP